MGSWSGHTLPGSLFIFFGVIWTIKTSYRYFFSGKVQSIPNRRCAKFKWDVLEAGFKIFGAGFGVLIEQLLPWEPWFHLHDAGSEEFNRANNWSHSTMYAFFCVLGITEILVIKFPKLMPHGVHYITMALAFGVEGYLFYFHTHGREELDVRVHVLLLCAIWPTSLMALVLAVIDNNENLANCYELPPRSRQRPLEERNEQDSISLLQNGNENARNETTTLDHIPLNEKQSDDWGFVTDVKKYYGDGMEIQKIETNRKKIFTVQLCISTATILQGMWFWQAAYVLYPPNSKPWDQESHKNIAFLTMFFTWYLLFAIFMVGGIFVFFAMLSRRKCRKAADRHYSSLQTEDTP